MFETPIQVSFSKFENLSEMKHPTADGSAVHIFLAGPLACGFYVKSLVT